ncbi:hypothetical protein ACORG1_13165 [Mycobacterium sp. TJFP1]
MMAKHSGEHERHTTGIEGRLTITFDGTTLFDDVIDAVECTHSVQRRVDPLDFDPKRGTVTLTATYEVKPKSLPDPSPELLAALAAAAKHTRALRDLFSPVIESGS